MNFEVQEKNLISIKRASLDSSTHFLELQTFFGTFLPQKRLFSAFFS